MAGLFKNNKTYFTAFSGADSGDNCQQNYVRQTLAARIVFQHDLDRPQTKQTNLAYLDVKCHSVRTYLFSILFLISGVGCAGHRDALVSDHRYRVFFPAIQLDKANLERIESLEIKMSCGRFRAIGTIPDDWSAEVVSPSSEQTTLKASAGHGASTLWSMRELDGSITISVEETSCFDITATVATTATEHRYARSDLILKP